MTSLLGLAIKLTGTTPSGLPHHLPGGKLQGKAKGEVSSYLAIIPFCARGLWYTLIIL